MKKVLETIRTKSPEFRIMLSVVLALVVTGGIAAFWLWTISLTPKPAAPVAPSPFNALRDSISGAVTSVKNPSSSTTPTSSPQIIDAGVEASAEHDETNPYQSVQE